MKAKDDLKEVFKEYLNFLNSQKTLELGTLNTEGNPELSYAPFVKDEKGCFYVYISGLAPHTAHLKTHAMTGVLLIEDEQQVQQLFARKRAAFQCQPETIQRDSDEWKLRMEDFSERFGPIMEMLKTLSDFVMFRLTPTSASFVKGFGLAYQLHGENLSEIRHVRLDSK